MFKIEKFDLLVAIYVFCIVATELMGGKTFAFVNLFGYQLNASVAIFLFPFVFTINDVITEVHGKDRAKSVIRSGLLTVFLVFCFSILAVHLPASTRFAGTEAAYDKIFGLSTRIAAASLIALSLAEFCDVYIFSAIRRRLGDKALWLRNNASNFAAQFLDTAIFMVLAFYSLDKGFGNNIHFLVSLILPYWLLKCAMSIVETPFVYAGVKWLRKTA